MEASSVLEAFLLTEAQCNPSFPFDEIHRAWEQLTRPSTKLSDLGKFIITNPPSEAASILPALERILCGFCDSKDVDGVRRRLRIAILSALEDDRDMRQRGAEDSAGRPKRMHSVSSGPQQSPRKRRLDGPRLSRLVSLPTELIARICSLLDLHSQTALACTCRSLRAVTETLLSREPAVAVRRAVTHAIALCDSLPPLSRAGALQEVSLALELEARLCYARTELHRRAELVQSGAMFRLEYAPLQESQRKEMLRLARSVGLQMAYLYHMQPADPLQEDDVRLSSQQVETVRNLSQAVPPAMDEAERGWFDWHAFPLHKREGWDPASVHVLRVFFTIGELPVIVEVISPWSTTLAMANEIRIFSGGTGGRRELVVIFSRTDGIDRHRWPRVAPLFVPLNTALAPPQLCLFILLASTITEEGGFPNWLQGLLQEWEHESN